MKLGVGLRNTLRSLAAAERTWTITMTDEYYVAARKLQKHGLVYFEPRYLKRGKYRGELNGYDIVVTPSGKAVLDYDE